MSAGQRTVVIAAASLGKSARTVPLGAARIVSSLRAHPALSARISAELVSALAADDAAGLVRSIRARRPWAAGFSLYVWNRDLLLAAARELRRACPGLVLFAGGPEATADPNSVLEEGGLDFVVAGEGEEAAPLALERILDGGSPAAVPGVFSALARDSGESRGRPDLARLPSPYLDGTLDIASYGGALWELARGCPFACHFCYESKGGRGVRRFPDSTALSELRAFARAGAREVFVLDPTFNADPAKAREVLALIRREAPGIHFTFEVRAEFLDAALARGFAAIPCSVQVGLESARPEVLAAVGRAGFDRREFRRKTALLSSAGVVFGLDLIYGLPGDDLAGFRDSLDYALALEPNHLDVFRLSVLPGTVLADGADDLALERERRPPYGVLSTPSFPARDLERAEALAGAADLFYSRGRAVGWFPAVLRPLRTRPSAFLESAAGRPAGSIGGSGPSGQSRPAPHLEIEAYQLEVLEAAYRRAGAERLFPLIRDLVTLHGAWSRALAEGETTRLCLSRHPDDLFGPASRDPARMSRAVPEARGEWVVRPGGSGPVVEPRGR